MEHAKPSVRRSKRYISTSYIYDPNSSVCDDFGTVTRKRQLRYLCEAPSGRSARPIEHPNQIEPASVPRLRTSRVVSRDQITQLWNRLVLPIR